MAKVAIKEAGIATAAMIVERHDRMKISTTKVASRLPTIRCFWISCMAARMYRDWSWITSTWTSGGRICSLRLQPLLDGLDHVHRVFPGLPLHGQHDRRAAVQPRQVADFLGRVDGLAQVAEPDGHPAGRGDDHLQKIARFAEAAQRPQAEFAGAGVDAAAGDIGILANQGVADLEDRQLVRRQPLGLDVDLHRPVLGPVDGHLADPGRRLDQVLDVTVRQHEQFARLPVAGQGQRQDRRRFQVLLADDGRIDVLRQAIQHAVDGVAHILGGGVDVAIDLKGDQQQRHAFAADRPQLFDPGHRGDRVFHAVA